MCNYSGTSIIIERLSSFRDNLYNVQWNPSNPDTIGPEESVLIREVSFFQGLKSTQTWYLGRKKVYVLFREVLISGVSL